MGQKRRVGVTEREVMAEIEAAMRRAGAESTGIDTIVASGPHTRPILARSTFRQIQADELVLLTETTAERLHETAYLIQK